MSNDKGLNFIITINYAKGKVLSASFVPTSKVGCYCAFEAVTRDHALETFLEAWLEAYSRKEWLPIDTIPFAWEYLPPFTQDALKMVSKIPPGEVLTYQEVAIAIGHPTAARAVGGACGRNLFPLFIPCHRVLDTNRKMRGYSAGSGIPFKEALLSHEGFL